MNDDMIKTFDVDEMQEDTLRVLNRGESDGAARLHVNYDDGVDPAALQELAQIAEQIDGYTLLLVETEYNNVSIVRYGTFERDRFEEVGPSAYCKRESGAEFQCDEGEYMLLTDSNDLYL